MPGVEKIEFMVFPSKARDARLEPQPVRGSEARPPEADGAPAAVARQPSAQHPGRSADAISVVMDGQEHILEPTD